MTENIFENGGELDEKWMMIPIDDGVTPDGYEAVRFGVPAIGEEYLSASGILSLVNTSEDRQAYPRLIIRETIASPPQIVPWESPDDVPDPCWFRWKSTKMIVGPFIGECVKADGKTLRWQIGVNEFHTNEMFQELEYHTDRRAKEGWQPCGKPVHA